MKKVFIDGSAGTTGLRIRERLAARADIELLTLPEELRKDAAARRDALNAADVAFLCLPDAAAIEAAELVTNPATVLIDTSTAHRTADGWEYGFPELVQRRARIAAAKRIANPGCHATGFIALVEPLVHAGLVPASARLTAFSLTGYSGGGKKMIAEYEEKLAVCSLQFAAGASDANEPQTANCKLQAANYLAGRQYALGQMHKHLPEMAKVCALEEPPVFSPVIVPHFSGMETTVMLPGDLVKGGLRAVADCYREYYHDNGVVRFAEPDALPEILSSADWSGRDDLAVSVHGLDARMVLVAQFDNLGKGACGAAIQNMNLALGVREDEGLVCA